MRARLAAPTLRSWRFGWRFAGVEKNMWGVKNQDGSGGAPRGRSTRAAMHALCVPRDEK
jgi:hypothetical protein